jgi:hypothetical protein
MAPTLELRKGTRILYRSAAEDMLQEGQHVRGSTTGEEWLVKNRFGEYWVPVTQLRPALEPQPDH